VVIEKCTARNTEERFKSVKILRGALLTVLLEPEGLSASRTAKEWAQHLKDLPPSADDFDLEGLAGFVENLGDRDDKWTVFSSIDDQVIEKLHGRAPWWDRIISKYCEWVKDTGFDFDYCDVLAERLEKAFGLGTVEERALIALALAEMASKHNRWFAMRVLIRICGKGLDAPTARRIAVEIKVSDFELHFCRCADVVHEERDEYHPLIAATIAEPAPDDEDESATEFVDDIPF
jgi:hypothetical protein